MLWVEFKKKGKKSEKGSCYGLSLVISQKLNRNKPTRLFVYFVFFLIIDKCQFANLTFKRKFFLNSIRRIVHIPH